MSWNLNLNTLSFDALMRLIRLDEKYIRTEDYMGVAYFWAYEYRHYLRDATISQRRRVQRAFLKAGLKVDGESPEHFAIVKKITGKR